MTIDNLGISAIEIETKETIAANRVASFANQIHQSLDPQKVKQIAVQELRPILQCDRVCFLDRRNKKFRLVAASDQPGIPPRSRQASLLEQFVAEVMQSGERFQFPEDHDDALPEDLSRLLATYWDHANCQMIHVEPVFTQFFNSDSEVAPKPEIPRTIVGAIVIERFFSSSLNPGAIECVDLAMEHLTPALANANSYSRLVAIPGLFHCGVVLDLIRRSRRISTLIYFLMIGSFLVVASLWERPFEIECSGRIVPAERRQVFAGCDGEVTEVLVDESAHVQSGQIIARLQSLELEKAILEQTGLLKGKLKARDAARADLRTRTTPQVRSQSVRDQVQFEVVNSEIETIHQQLELLESEKSQLVVRSPISGTITSNRPRERLLGRPVHRGESLLEIMDESGAWQLELAVPEQRIGHLLSYQQHHPKVNVRFRLRSTADQSFTCSVTRLADRIIPSPGRGSCGLVFCDISNTDLPVRQIGSEVGARIHCGERSLLFIWLHEFWELLQRHWWM